ncbi:MAG TPA: DMT family transporter, partial [Burkholderiaceae bacterium]|nr:DMT family transporter [Burkholderiaceae bacterium]
MLAWREGLAGVDYQGRFARAGAIGMVGMCGSPALVFGGLMLTRPEVAAVIVATQPAMTALAEWLGRGRRPALFTIVCIVVAFFGVVTVVTRWSVSLAPQGLELAGDLMVLAGAACWVAYTMSVERFRGWSTLRFTALTMAPGAVANVALALLLAALGVVAVPAASDWLAVMPQAAYLAFVGVLASMMFWNAAIHRIGPLNAILFVNLIPIVTFAIRHAGGHRFEPIELLGAAIVVAALIANNVYLRFTARSAALPLPPARPTEPGRPAAG